MASTDRREQPTTAKRAAIQAAVLAATEELLAEGVSFADLGIEKIATRAGISRTAFYFYFADKRELLMRLTEEVNALLFEQADAWFSSEEDPEGSCAPRWQHRAALRRAQRPAPRDRRGLDLRRGGRGRSGARRSGASSTPPSAASSRSSRRPLRRRRRPRDRLRAHLDDRTHALPGARAGAAGRHEALVDAMAGIWLRSIYDG